MLNRCYKGTKICLILANSLSMMSMNLKILGLTLLVGLFSFGGAARELSDLSLEILSTKKGAEAKQEALDQASEEATRKITEELLGPEKTAQSWPTLRPKLLKSSTRFILFTKVLSAVELPDSTKVTVQMRVAPDNVEALLRDMGLFAGGTVRVLPLISVTEGRGSHYVWWAETGEERGGSLAQDYFKKMLAHLNAQFKGKSIYVLDPQSASFRMSVPSAYRTENLRREDQALLGQYLKADVILSGRMDVQKVRSDAAEQRLSYNLQLWQAKNGRTVHELARTETAANDQPKLIQALLDQTDKKVFGELAGRLADAVSGGQLNLSIVRLTAVGNLNFKHQNDLRRQLSELREVRAVKERLFEPSRVTYEIETAVSGAELGRAIQRQKFAGFVINIDSVQDNGLVLSVRPTSVQ